MILYVEHTVDAADLATALWRFCNNLDPKRDSTLVATSGSNSIPAKPLPVWDLMAHGKQRNHDNFQRDWPNIIVADDATIKSVDEKWEQPGLR